MKANRSIPSAQVIPVLIYPDVREAVAWLEAMRIALTPGDSRDDALTLEAAGLGRVVELEDGRWAWSPTTPLNGG